MSENNIARLTNSEDEYQEFIYSVEKFIIEVNYQKLSNFFEQNIIDNNKNIAQYSEELLDLYFTNNIKYSNKHFSNKKQRVVFWYQSNSLYRYISPYPISALMAYENNILIFYRNKKSDKLPLASMVNKSGKELFKINFPTKDDSECISENISYYGAKSYKENRIIQIIFTNGICRFDFWCKYSLTEKKYIDSDFWK